MTEFGNFRSSCIDTRYFEWSKLLVPRQIFMSAMPLLHEDHIVNVLLEQQPNSMNIQVSHQVTLRLHLISKSQSITQLICILLQEVTQQQLKDSPTTILDALASQLLKEGKTQTHLYGCLIMWHTANSSAQSRTQDGVDRSDFSFSSCGIVIENYRKHFTLFHPHAKLH